MKFLMFNFVVAAALVFLFAGERGELTAIAEKAEKTISVVKEKAAQTIGRSTGLSETAAVSQAQRDTPVEKPSEKLSPAPKVQVSPPRPLATPLTTSNPHEPRPKIDAPPAGRPQSPLTPAVAKRRSEVLETGPSPAKKGVADQFMSADIRKRELILLAEKMELFSAQAISR